MSPNSLTKVNTRTSLDPHWGSRTDGGTFAFLLRVTPTESSGRKPFVAVVCIPPAIYPDGTGISFANSVARDFVEKGDLFVVNSVDENAFREVHEGTPWLA